MKPAVSEQERIITATRRPLVAATDVTGLESPEVVPAIDAGTAPSELHYSNFLKKTAAGLMAALAIGGFSAAASRAEARPNTALPAVEMASSPNKSPKVTVPRLPGLIPLARARVMLRRAGLYPAGLQPGAGGKLPKARPGYELVASGWSKRIIRPVRGRDGKLRRQVSYPAVRPGSKLPRGSRLFIRTRQRAISGIPPADSLVPPSIEEAPQAPPLGIAPPQPKAPVPPEPIESLPSPEIDVAAETAKFLASDTVQLPFLNNCSGLLVRDSAGRIIGAASAQHCGLGPGTPRIRGSDGNLYVVRSEPLEVRRGESTAGMTTAFTASQAIVPADGDPNHDLALIVRRGSSPEQVIAAYRKNLVSESQVFGVSQGTKVYLSGYPEAQPGNGSGVPRRQIMEAEYIGPTNVYTSNGQTIYSVMVGLAPNTDGAVCSYGNSGGPAVIPRVVREGGAETVKFTWLGINTAYDDFREPGENTVVAEGYYGPAIREERYRQSGYNVVLKPAIKVVCYFDFRVPGPVTVRLVNSADQIPGYGS